MDAKTIQPKGLNYEIFKQNRRAGIFSQRFFVGAAQASLVNSYDFSGNALDETGSLNGTVYGATLTTDRFGSADSAYYFDGSDAISVGFDSPATASYSFWATRPVDTNNMLFNTGAELAGPDLYFQCGGINWNIWDGCDNPLGNGSSANLVGPQWHQYVLVNDASSNAKLYVDGALFGTARYRAPGDTLTIGKGSVAGLDFGWIGSIDDVKIFNTALSAGEVSDLHAIGSVQSQNASEVSAPLAGVSLALLGLFAAGRRSRRT